LNELFKEYHPSTRDHGPRSAENDRYLKLDLRGIIG